MEVQARDVRALADEHVGRTLFGGCIVDEDVYVLDLREVANDFAVDPRDGLEFVGPVLGLCGQAIQVEACGAHSAGMRKFCSRGFDVTALF